MHRTSSVTSTRPAGRLRRNAGEIAADGLSESELIEVPSTGHTTIVNECARRIMTDFLRSPGGDRSCLDHIPPIEWR